MKVLHLCDPGFCEHLVTSKVQDLEHLLENVVYLELRRRYSEVCIGKVEKDCEVDFVAQNQDGIHYYQVALSVLDPNTLERELAAFKGIKDNYPKTLLTLDTIGKDRTFDGVEQVNVLGVAFTMKKRFKFSPEFRQSAVNRVGNGEVNLRLIANFFAEFL